MYKNIYKLQIRAACLLLVFAGSMAAQSTLGTITGLVVDRTGAVIPNAVVVATNTATGTKAQTVSSATGNYVIPSLQVGTYEINVTV
ncbi:MAG: carboxypeptidase regulatory-like domain-containing protein, partial [Blastocatellia bacterium]|nr:carboxypeptidase regulatory-like domain-containing protein [Blastocatellia bacterium]